MHTSKIGVRLLRRDIRRFKSEGKYAADTVINFDPWWNPAVEAQATDRAHRIGQTRVVTAYKLITRNT